MTLAARPLTLLPCLFAPATSLPASLLPSLLFPESRDVRTLERENRELRLKIALLERKQSQPQRSLSQHQVGTVRNASTAMTRARLESIAGHQRQLILTFVNRARIDFAFTWAAHLRRMGLTNWLIGATDPEALRQLVEAHTPCVDLHTSLPDSEWAWGSPSFHQLGPTKVRLIKTALDFGLEIVITDVDALVLRPPFAYMARWPDAGFLTTSDHLRNTTSDDGLESHAAQSAYNIVSARAAHEHSPCCDFLSAACLEGDWRWMPDDLPRAGSAAHARPMSSS